MPEPQPWDPGNYGDIPYDAGAPHATGFGAGLAGAFNSIGGAFNNAYDAAAPFGVAPTIGPSTPPTGPDWWYQPAQPSPYSVNMHTLPPGTTANDPSTGLPYPAISQQTGGNPNVAQYDASRGLINANQDALDAKRKYTNQLPTKYAAEGNVLDARQRALSSQSSYLNEQQRANSARMQDEQAIQAAKQNPANAIAVARAERERSNTDYRYKIAGLSTPIEIQMPDGFQGTMPPGMRERLETIADKLTRQATDRDKLRQYNLEAARIATAAAGQEVTAAEIASGRVSLTLDQAEQAMRLAGLDVDQAQINAQASKQPPAPGYVWDAKTQQWIHESFAKTKESDLGDDGGYGSLSLSTLEDMRNKSIIDDAAFISALTRPKESGGKYGFQDATAQMLLQLAESRKPKGADPGLNFDALFGAGSDTQTPAAPAGPTTAIGSINQFWR